MRLVELLQVTGAVLGVLASILTVIEKRLVTLFRRVEATSPETAMELPRLGASSRWRLSRLVSARAAIAVRERRFYLDEAAYTSLRKRRAVLGVTLVVLALALVTVLHMALR